MGSDEIIKNMYDVSDDMDEEENITRFVTAEYMGRLMNNSLKL